MYCCCEQSRLYTHTRLCKKTLAPLANCSSVGRATHLNMTNQFYRDHHVPAKVFTLSTDPGAGAKGKWENVRGILGRSPRIRQHLTPNGLHLMICRRAGQIIYDLQLRTQQLLLGHLFGAALLVEAAFGRQSPFQRNRE